MILTLLDPLEREVLNALASYCPTNYRPLDRAPIIASRTKARALAKLGLVDIRRGDIDGAMLVRLSKLGADSLARAAKVAT